MTRYHAAWIVPITAPPIRRGWVEVVDGVVAALGSDEPRPRRMPAGGAIHLDSKVILPGLVNAHTHLELSGLRGSVPPAQTMPAWARQVMAYQEGARTLEDEAALRAAVGELRRAGTALVGDVSNTLASVGPLEESSIYAVVFREVLGFDVADGEVLVKRLRTEIAQNRRDQVRLVPAAHAPYSVAPALFVALRGAVTDGRLPGPLSVHLAESLEELEFLRSGTGPWRAILEEHGRWNPRWHPPREGPVEYLERLGWVKCDTLAVHGVHLTRAELNRLARAGATLVTCPRSNVWTGAGVPPETLFYTSGVRLAVGTDSLASTPDLNLFAEIAEIRRLAPAVSASAVLETATLQGATALGFGDELGAIEPSRRAALIAVELPGPIDDVEEYLLSGIEPDQISWLEDITGAGLQD